MRSAVIWLQSDLWPLCAHMADYFYLKNKNNIVLALVECRPTPEEQQLILV